MIAWLSGWMSGFGGTVAAVDCALDAGAAVWCADGLVSLPRPTVALAAGGGRACALDPAGTARCFGEGIRGFEELPGDIVDLGGGAAGICWLDAAGTVGCRGAGLPERVVRDDVREVEVFRGEVCTIDGTRAVRCGSRAIVLPGPPETLRATDDVLCAEIDGAPWCWADDAPPTRVADLVR